MEICKKKKNNVNMFSEEVKEIKKISKQNLIVPLTLDFMFKRVFTKNPDLLKQFLISVLKLEMDPENSSIRIENTELPKTSKREYRKTVDILVVLDGNKTIDVELNSSTFNEIKYRNALYIEKIMTTNLEQGTSKEDMSKYYYYQLNLNIHKFKEDIGEKCFYLKEDTTNELLIDNLKIIHKSLDYYTKLYYNDGKKCEKDVIWLALINAKNLSEIEEMTSLIMDNNEKEKFMKDVTEASRDKFILSEWESDKLAEMVKRESMKQAKLEGIEQGIEQNTRTLIHEMLKKKMSLEDICDITGKSIDEIKEIECSIKLEK